MDYSIEFVSDPDGVVITTSGRADVDGVKRMIADAVHDERFFPGMPVLVDHRALDPSGLTDEDAVAIREQLASLSERIGASRAALVLPDPRIEELAEATMPSDAEADLVAHVFYSVEDGVAWLREQGG